jgi:hypothetical protein
MRKDDEKRCPPTNRHDVDLALIKKGWGWLVALRGVLWIVLCFIGALFGHSTIHLASQYLPPR